MAKAGWCASCAQYVWLTPEGACPNGHDATQISQVYDAEPTPAADAGSTLDQVAEDVGRGLQEAGEAAKEAWKSAEPAVQEASDAAADAAKKAAAAAKSFGKRFVEYGKKQAKANSDGPMDFSE